MATQKTKPQKRGRGRPPQYIEKDGSRREPVRIYLSQESKDFIDNEAETGMSKSSFVDHLIRAEINRRGKMGGHTELECFGALLSSGKLGEPDDTVTVGSLAAGIKKLSRMLARETKKQANAHL